MKKDEKVHLGNLDKKNVSWNSISSLIFCASSLNETLNITEILIGTSVLKPESWEIASQVGKFMEPVFSFFYNNITVFNQH